MLATTDLKMSGSEKKGEEEHMRHFLHKTCTRKIHVEVVQNNCKEQSVLHVLSSSLPIELIQLLRVVE